MKDNLVIENRIQGSSLSEISLNNLYNLMTNPESVATSLIIIAAVVRCVLYLNEPIITYDRSMIISKNRNGLDKCNCLYFMKKTTGMLLWLLPTFLWTGQELKEDDRPFQKIFQQTYHTNNLWNANGIKPHDINKRKNRHALDRGLPDSNTTKTNSTIVNLYNKLLCPNCVARTAVINGIPVSKWLAIYNF